MQPYVPDNFMSHDSFSEGLFEVLWLDEALDKSSFNHLSPKKFLGGNMSLIRLKITQPTAKHYSMMWCNS